jgi:hypothetical protein
MEEASPPSAEQANLLAGQQGLGSPQGHRGRPGSPPLRSRVSSVEACCSASPTRQVAGRAVEGGTEPVVTRAAAQAQALSDEPLLRPSRVSDQLDPITNLGVLFIDVGEVAPAGWSVLSRTASGREANLNKGTGGRKIQLCFTRARGEPPLTDLTVVCRQPGQAFDPHEDFTIVEQTVGGRRANLNEGSGGAQLYIAYRRCRRATVSAAAAAVAALSGESAMEEEERAPIVDLAVLYTTLADGHLLASANVIGEGYLMVRNMVRDQKGRTVTQAPADMNAGSHRLLQKLRNLDTPWNHTRQSEVRLYYKKRSTRRQKPDSAHQQKGFVWPSRVGHASPDEIDCVRQLGDGAVGSIWLVRYGGADPGSRSGHGPSPSLSGLYALKLLRKERMIRKGKVERVMNELEILRTVDHPFVVTLHASFQTPHFLCHMMEYCPGGNLYDLLQAQPHKCVIEEHARFYAAQVRSTSAFRVALRSCLFYLNGMCAACYVPAGDFWPRVFALQRLHLSRHETRKYPARSVRPRAIVRL